MHYKNKKVSKRRKIQACIAIIISISGITFLSLSPSLYINTLIISPLSYKKEVEAIIYETYNNKIFYIFSPQHVVFIQKDSITKKIEQHFSEIHDVTISRKNLNTLSLSLERRMPLFRKEDNLAIDTYGIVYTEKNNIDTLPLFTTSIILSNRETLQAIAEFATKISIRIDTVSHIDINKDSDVYYYFVNKKCVLKTALSKDANATWSTLISALDHDTLKSALQKDKNDLEYIDLRFGNKVFYSFEKNGTTTASTTTL